MSTDSRITSGRSPASTIDWSSSTIATNAWMQFSDRVAMPGASSALRRASKNVIRSRSAYAATQASARSPMPRLGVFRIRRSEISSAGLASIRRYASASRTSRRS